MSVEADREEILRLHRWWWESNFTFDIPKMRSVFAGERYLQYNLNGHPYYGLEEKPGFGKRSRATSQFPRSPSQFACAWRSAATWPGSPVRILCA